MRGSKDAALAFAARSLINSRLHALGEVTDLSLNTAHHRVHLRVALRGETEPVDVAFSDVDVHSSNDGAMLTLGEAVASREWLTAALSEFVVGRAFHISRNAGRVLRLLT